MGPWCNKLCPDDRLRDVDSEWGVASEGARVENRHFPLTKPVAENSIALSWSW